MEGFMRKVILSFIAILFIFFCLNLYSQSSWNPPQKLTSGFVDRNPAFKSINNTGYGLNIFSNFEFFVFVRYNQPYSNIFLGKITFTGLMENVLPLTSGNFIRQNPCISYGSRNNYSDVINSSLVLWETNENARWDIYGVYYNRQTGWGSQFSFDNSNVTKSTPQCVCIDSNSYAITYVKSGDIIFRIFNPITQTVTYDTNLTVTDTAFCSNPHVALWNNAPSRYYIVTYEKRKPDSKRAIYYKKTSSLPVWTPADTAAYLGDNYFNSFTFMSNYVYPFGVCFTSDRTGYKDIYATTVPMPSGSAVQEKVFTNTVFNFYNFTSTYYPIITDYVYTHACAVLRNFRDSTKVIFDFRTVKDSTTICDTSKRTSITITAGFNSNSYLWNWVLYNKDSANVSQIWGRKKIIVLGDIRKTGNIVPEKFSLAQNYPNPFNPSTIIKFQIPKLSGVKLVVFDILGKEITTLVNEKLQPGEYEVTFDGSNLPSGVYIYKLQSGDFSDSKKLVLIK
jgi:hypothetical protein